MLRRVSACFLIGLFLISAVGGHPLMAATTRNIDNTDFPGLYLSEPALQGEAVWMLQARLREEGYDLNVNGIYGQETSNAVSLYQISNGMEVNGTVDHAVWQSLMKNTPSEYCNTSAPEKEQGRMLIVIDTADRSLTLYEDGKEVCRYPVAVGKSSTPTPKGEWRVVHKSVGWGNGFGTRWMGLNVPWGIFGIHGTNKPGSIGSYASHGCIRMFNRDVEKLYPLVPNGCRVRIVTNGRIVPDQIKPIVLKKNSTGQTVVYVQSRLKELGIEFDSADGRFGSMTELAVKYFQVWHGLEPDGVVDEEIYRAMGMIE